uniref:Putative secreted protein n=1 Tax=Ixodes ricinus TaxID=34613 RepID=A0A147BNV5_IXORI
MPKFVVLCGILALIIIAARSICASLVSQGVTQHNEKTVNGLTVLPGCPSSRAGTPHPPTLVVARRSELAVRVQACGSSFPSQRCVG